jgi:hypothetical protein
VRVAEALANHVREIGDGDFGIGQIRVPDFLPFEAVKAFVADRLQRLDLALDWNVPGSRQNVFAVFAFTD